MSLDTCDGCTKPRRDVQPVGRDSNGSPDGPGLCFVCRREGARGRLYDRSTGRYREAGYAEGEPECAAKA